MNKVIKNYIEGIEDLDRVSDDPCSSFMDISVRIDRVKNLKEKAIVHLGEIELKKIMAKAERCENCGCRDCAEYIENPYNKEVYSNKAMRWLCADCYNKLVMDI